MRNILGATLALLVTGGLALAAAPVAAAAVPDFTVGMQLADRGGRGGFGAEQFTPLAGFGGGVSPFIGDSDFFDPDGARLDLNLGFAGIGSLDGIDFRIGGQAGDNGAQLGDVVFTPWASQGGGQTGVITDDNSFDPDMYRLFLQIRPLPAGLQINDMRLSIRAFDIPDRTAGAIVFTPWASQGGGLSPFALDDNAFDPDGFVIGLEVV